MHQRLKARLRREAISRTLWQIGLTLPWVLLGAAGWIAYTYLFWNGEFRWWMLVAIPLLALVFRPILGSFLAVAQCSTFRILPFFSGWVSQSDTWSTGRRMLANLAALDAAAQENGVPALGGFLRENFFLNSEDREEIDWADSAAMLTTIERLQEIAEARPEHFVRAAELIEEFQCMARALRCCVHEGRRVTLVIRPGADEEGVTPMEMDNLRARFGGSFF